MYQCYFVYVNTDFVASIKESYLMALDRRIIAIFCFSFLGFTMIMVLNDYNCPYDYVDTFEAEVAFAHIEKDSILGSFSRRLVNY